ncbi:MAG: sigma-54 dependent transcriptional regulator [Pseudomonadota bacterium]
MKPIVLYIDDDQANLDTFKRVFRFDYDVRLAPSGFEGLDIIKREPEIALIITDQRMPKMTGIEFLKEAMKLNPHPQRIILTAFTDNEALLKAINDGHVYDYVVKPWKPESLKKICDGAIEIYKERIEKIKRLKAAETKVKVLEDEIKSNHNFLTIIGAEGGLSSVMEQVRKVASTPSTVLIRGETGTGKELIARAIHDSSPRSDKPFVAVHCAALSPGVLESELFGHEKGSFTGALHAKAGRFELADEGTLFLDEIGDLPDQVQVKLLRAIQERRFERVGGVDTKEVNVRLIAATHQPLEQFVANGKFRQDLFYRLNVIPITLPALRERREDIPYLIDHFIAKFSREFGKNLKMSHEATSLLCEYDWPGNIRELQNIIERAAVLGDGELAPNDLGIDLEEAKRVVNSTVDSSVLENKDVLNAIKGEEAVNLIGALRKASGNISEAARVLNLPRSTLVHRLKKYQIL